MTSPNPANYICPIWSKATATFDVWTLLTFQRFSYSTRAVVYCITEILDSRINCKLMQGKCDAQHKVGYLTYMVLEWCKWFTTVGLEVSFKWFGLHQKDWSWKVRNEALIKDRFMNGINNAGGRSTDIQSLTYNIFDMLPSRLYFVTVVVQMYIRSQFFH